MSRTARALFLLIVMAWQTLSFLTPFQIRQQAQSLGHAVEHLQALDHHHHEDQSLHADEGGGANESPLHHTHDGVQPSGLSSVITMALLDGEPASHIGVSAHDVPALAKADIGIAMGGAGTDTAMEAADVVIMNDDLRRIPELIRLSRLTHAVLWQNISLALGIKAVFLVLAVFGHASMWMAVFADMGPVCWSWPMACACCGPARAHEKTLHSHGHWVDILRTMRRLIAILLMIVLPLQLSWAVAATYCQDEQDPGAQHFGHHVHLHQDGADTGKHPTKSTQKAENDCGCSGHLCSAHLLPVGLDAWSATTAERQFVALETHLHLTSDPPRIERPNWIDSL